MWGIKMETNFLHSTWQMMPRCHKGESCCKGDIGESSGTQLLWHKVGAPETTKLKCGY